MDSSPHTLPSASRSRHAVTARAFTARLGGVRRVGSGVASGWGTPAGPSGVPAWEGLPSWYVVVGADRVVPPALQRFVAERAGSGSAQVKGASYVVMMSRPDVVVRQIDPAYRATR
ncbi:alpha/beta fold hydrolase [Streptomyces sp. NPDC006872]|uniref:alpha/beta fold hydrolase n=1 Tax=Streptomyces sp. NPDC006872 TaxID=3155720 RepID=UPI0033CFE0BD